MGDRNLPVVNVSQGRFLNEAKQGYGHDPEVSLLHGPASSGGLVLEKWTDAGFIGG